MWTSLSRAAETVTFVSLKNFHFVFARFLCKLQSYQCYSTHSWLLKNFIWSPQVLIVPSKCCFRADNSHLHYSWAKSQKQQSTLQHTWASRTLCLVSGANCLHPISSRQNWTFYVSCSPSQSLQESACTFAIPPLSPHRQSFPPTLSHPNFWTPIHLARCVISVYVVARNKN